VPAHLSLGLFQAVVALAALCRQLSCLQQQQQQVLAVPVCLPAKASRQKWQHWQLRRRNGTGRATSSSSSSRRERRSETTLTQPLLPLLLQLLVQPALQQQRQVQLQ
jgi:hypothetical protein